MRRVETLGVVLIASTLAMSCAPQEARIVTALDAQAKQLGELEAAVKRLQIDATPIAMPGRYQVMNGTPEFARNIMLVDTQTGRVWLHCNTKDKDAVVDTGWCAMDFYGEAPEP